MLHSCWLAAVEDCVDDVWGEKCQAEDASAWPGMDRLIQVDFFDDRARPGSIDVRSDGTIGAGTGVTGAAPPIRVSPPGKGWRWLWWDALSTLLTGPSV